MEWSFPWVGIFKVLHMYLDLHCMSYVKFSILWRMIETVKQTRIVASSTISCIPNSIAWAITRCLFIPLCLFVLAFSVPSLYILFFFFLILSSGHPSLDSMVKIIICISLVILSTNTTCNLPLIKASRILKCLFWK